MKYITVKISEIAKHPTMRMDAKYWIKKNQKKSKKRSSTQNNRNIILDESKIILSSDEIGVWYFNNPTVISRGRNEFISKWGERELEDNWRLLSKISFSEQEEQEEQETTDNVLSEIAVEESDVDIFSAMKSLPFDEGEKILLNKETEKAFYELGKLYIQNLEEKIKGIDIYEKFITRFDNSELLPDVYYQLYLVSENKDYYKNIIINEYSESIYSKLIINPNYEIDDFKEYNTLLEIYGKLYNQLISENNNKVINAVDSLAKLYGENEFFEKISLLKAIAIGKKGGNFSLQFELKNFLNFANEKSTIEYASALLNSAEKVHEEFVYSGLPLFNSNKDERFFFVIVNETEKTIDYLKNKPMSPQKDDWDKAVEYWSKLKTDKDANFDKDACAPLKSFGELIRTSPVNFSIFLIKVSISSS